jgi:hypothetical protein
VKSIFGQSEILDQSHLSQNGFKASVVYGFRLKKKRLEFHPGIGYRSTWNSESYDGYLNAIDLDLNTAIYPFDFGGDCDCPTFSKEGDLFKKGFFLEINPGVAYQTLHRVRGNTDPTNPLPFSDNNMVFKIGVGGGLDIGLSDQFTLTPLFALTWQSSNTWDGLNPDGSAGMLDDDAYLSAGLRVTYKPDPKGRRRRY